MLLTRTWQLTLHVIDGVIKFLMITDEKMKWHCSRGLVSLIYWCVTMSRSSSHAKLIRDVYRPSMSCHKFSMLEATTCYYYHCWLFYLHHYIMHWPGCQLCGCWTTTLKLYHQKYDLSKFVRQVCQGMETKKDVITKLTRNLFHLEWSLRAGQPILWKLSRVLLFIWWSWTCLCQFLYSSWIWPLIHRIPPTHKHWGLR